jgi:hypothetical protein
MTALMLPVAAKSSITRARNGDCSEKMQYLQLLSCHLDKPREIAGELCRFNQGTICVAGRYQRAAA